MQSPIVFYIIRTDDQVATGGPELLDLAGLTPEAFGEDLEKVEIWLHDPITWAMQQKAEKAITTLDKATGFMVTDEERRPGAMVSAYVAKWTLPQEPTEEGFNLLHPNIALEIKMRLPAKIFPNIGSTPDFMNALRDKQKGLTNSAQA